MDVDIETGAPILGRIAGVKPNTDQFERMAALGAEAEHELASAEGRALIGRAEALMVDLIDHLVDPKQTLTGDAALQQVGMIQGLRILLDGLYGPIQMGKMAAARLAAQRTR